MDICTVKKNELQVFLPTRKFLPNTIILKEKKKQVIEWYVQYDTVYAKQTSHKRILPILSGYRCMLEIYRKKL